MTDHSVKTVAVLGGGTMGHGIAQVAAMAGFETRLYDIDQKLVDLALARIDENLVKGIAKAKVTPEEKRETTARLRGEADLGKAVDGVDLVIEAVPERIELKRAIFGRLSELAPAGAVLASNTSSLSVAKIAESVADPSRVCGMHFFNPVHILALCEVIRADATSEATIDRARGVAEAMGKTPIIVKDSPGFASSRLGVTLGLEAIRMVEEGVASAEDIDTAMTLGYKHPMGPLRLGDLVGLDVRLAIAEYLHAELGDERFRPPELLRTMVAEGKLGQKSGQGFYDWS